MGRVVVTPQSYAQQFSCALVAAIAVQDLDRRDVDVERGEVRIVQVPCCLGRGRQKHPNNLRCCSSMKPWTFVACHTRNFLSDLEAEEMKGCLRSWWPLLGAITAAVLIATIQAGNLPDEAFYEMAAQVIPVLIVALAVESRAHNFWDQMPNVFNYQVVFFLAVGELSAILAMSGVMASSEYSDSSGVIGPTVGISYAMLGATVAGLSAGFIAVLVLALRGAVTSRAGTKPR